MSRNTSGDDSAKESFAPPGFQARRFNEREREDLESFFHRHSDLFFAALNQGYPLDEAMLDRFQDHWEWLLLSRNERLPWGDALIERFETHWHWWRLSDNTELPWSAELIERYRDKWDWARLSRNHALPWDEELVDRFRDRWDWRALSHSGALPWSLAFIERYRDKWDWSALSGDQFLPWSDTLVDTYCPRWDWKILSGNTALPWTGDFIEHHIDRWHWRTLSGNTGLPWREGFTDPPVCRWQDDYWDELDNNTLPSVSENFIIERFRSRWDWAALSGNPALPWSAGFIDCYSGNWDWTILSGNESLPWSNDLVERYSDRWHPRTLKANKALKNRAVDDLGRRAGVGHVSDPGKDQESRWSSQAFEHRAARWHSGKPLPRFARCVHQLTDEQVVRLLASYLNSTAARQTTHAVYDLRTFFGREPGHLAHCPACGGGIRTSSCEPSAAVARDIADTALLPVHYFSRQYVCDECGWSAVRERWGFLAADDGDCDYLTVEGARRPKERSSEPALDDKTYRTALPLPWAWGDLFEQIAHEPDGLSPN